MQVFRTNVAMGIPDWIFCLGESAILVNTQNYRFFVHLLLFLYFGIDSQKFASCPDFCVSCRQRWLLRISYWRLRIHFVLHNACTFRIPYCICFTYSIFACAFHVAYSIFHIPYTFHMTYYAYISYYIYITWYILAVDRKYLMCLYVYAHTTHTHTHTHWQSIMGCICTMTVIVLSRAYIYTHTEHTHTHTHVRRAS